jgi:hypothetical protein
VYACGDREEWIEIYSLPNATLIIKKDRNDSALFQILDVREYIRPSGLLRINLKNCPTWARFIAAISNLTCLVG